jgi:NAD(P)-dependent dehydrogenase (short-subunit alcohol dehydrogenase family)
VSNDHSHYFAGGVAVITGGGSGLGAAMAQRFAACGMTVFVLDIDGQHAQITADGIIEQGGKATALTVDVANRDDLQQAARLVEDQAGYCSVLCANVGVQQFGAIDSLTENDWRWVLDVNVMGVVHTVDAFLPLVRRAPKSRHILITSSSAAYSPGIRMAAYTTSKYAITGYGETLRMELAAEDIGVSLLFPAGMSTRHLQSSQQARPAELGPSELRREDIDAMMQSRKIDTGDHVASAEYATRHLLEDLKHNQRYIITHGDCREAINDQHQNLIKAQERGLQP